jgi:hypothetical protein
MQLTQKSLIFIVFDGNFRQIAVNASVHIFTRNNRSESFRCILNLLEILSINIQSMYIEDICKIIDVQPFDCPR